MQIVITPFTIVTTNYMQSCIYVACCILYLPVIIVAVKVLRSCGSIFFFVFMLTATRRHLSLELKMSCTNICTCYAYTSYLVLVTYILSLNPFLFCIYVNISYPVRATSFKFQTEVYRDVVYECIIQYVSIVMSYKKLKFFK